MVKRKVGRPVKNPMTMPAWMDVLTRIVDAKEATLNEIAEDARISYNHTVVLVQKMEKNKLVKTKPSKEDGRTKLVFPTAKANKLYEPLELVLQTI